MHRRLCTWAASIGFFVAGAIAAQTTEALPLDDLRPGQRGWGISVFEGSRAERFEVEILGVQRNYTAESSLIFARLTGRGLETAGVIAGMSGSPVYVDDKLVGAVALGYAFPRQAIAGITPIESMRRLAPAPAAALAPGALSPRLSVTESGALLDELTAARVDEGRFERAAARLRGDLGSGRAAVQWSTAGFGETARRWLGDRLQLAVETSGGAAPHLDASRLTAGGAVAAVLVDGDLRLAVTGTVTERRGDELLAFGHPFLGSGPIDIPLAPAEVITVVESAYSSFKVSNFGPIAGSFDVDRQAGIRGRLGVVPAMVPLNLRIGERSFRMRLAPMADLLPLLTALSTYGALDAAGQVAGAQSLSLDARFRLAGHGELRLRQDFDGERAATECAVYLLAIADFLGSNPLEQPRIESLDVDIQRADHRRMASLVSAHPDRTVVEPGSTVALALDLQAFRGERFRRTVEVTIPADVPDGKYSLIAGSGPTVDDVARGLEPAAPQTFAQALEFLRGLHARSQVVVLGVVAGRGVSVAGEVLPRLPPSMRSLWSASGTGAAAPLRFAVARRDVFALDLPIEGGVRLDLEVRRRAS
jgi:hypothetical protein